MFKRVFFYFNIWCLFRSMIHLTYPLHIQFTDQNSFTLRWFSFFWMKLLFEFLPVVWFGKKSSYTLWLIQHSQIINLSWRFLTHRWRFVLKYLMWIWKVSWKEYCFLLFRKFEILNWIAQFVLFYYQLLILKVWNTSLFVD